MSIKDRAKDILLKPRSEWEEIAKEPATVSGLFTGYAMILAALPAIATILALGIFGIGQDAVAMTGMSTGLGDTIVRTVIGYAVGLGMLYLMALIVKSVSPSFNGKSDMVQSLKLMTYASTPSWLIGIVTPFLADAPLIGLLLSIGTLAFVVYLIYTGLRPVLDVPHDKVAGFTVVIVLVYVVMIVLVAGVVFWLIGSNMPGGSAMSGA